MSTLEIDWSPILWVAAAGAALLGLLRMSEWYAGRRARAHTRALLARHRGPEA